MSVYQQTISSRFVPKIAPGESKPYGFDWAEFLAEVTGDTISVSAWECTGATLSADSNTSTTTQVTVTVDPSATVGTGIEVKNTITTAAGIIAIRTLPIDIADL